MGTAADSCLTVEDSREGTETALDAFLFVDEGIETNKEVVNNVKGSITLVRIETYVIAGIIVEPLVDVGNTVDEPVVLVRTDTDFVVSIFLGTLVDVCNTVDDEVVLLRTETDTDV